MRILFVGANVAKGLPQERAEAKYLQSHAATEFKLPSEQQSHAHLTIFRHNIGIGMREALAI